MRCGLVVVLARWVKSALGDMRAGGGEGILDLCAYHELYTWMPIDSVADVISHPLQQKQHG